MASSEPPDTFNVGSLYIAAFAQARAPHIALLIPTSTQSSDIVHIRIDRAASPTWAYHTRAEKISGNMFLTSLLKLHDATAQNLDIHKLRSVAATIPAPDNDTFGACSRWVFRVIEELHSQSHIVLKDIRALEEELYAFVERNRDFARRDRFPNVMVSAFCT